MKVLKFGGTSVGTAERMKSVAELINSDNEQKIVVLSAMSGTTNSLVEISDYFYKQNKSGALEKTNALEEKYADVIEGLFSNEKTKEKATEICHQIFQEIRAQAKGVFTLFEEKIVLAQGELLSTQLFQLYLEEQNVNSTLIPALDYMRIDKKNEPETRFIAENLNEILKEKEGYNIYVTQGYICRNFYGEIDNLQRGGSDYTASLVGAAIVASEIQIWTDIDGMHNNDPRIVENTKPVPT
ncbi:MAG: aspartate kinase, partial [Paludibacter sp.]